MIKPLPTTALLLIVSLTSLLFGQSPRQPYFQQQTDYRLNATLDVQKKVLTGSGEITYKNNSPDTLSVLWWHLYQNIFRANNTSRIYNAQISRAFEITDGITVDAISINGKSLTMNISETLMETGLPLPILPGSSVVINIQWHYSIPRTALLRTGSNGEDFGICQWYPQLCVYDNRYGWDKTPYLGFAEFYTDYGNWDVSLTLPSDYKVAATGVLQNAGEVLSPDMAQRLTSLSGTTITRIIKPEEVKDTTIFRRSKQATWHFTAANTRDFALAASPAFVWDAIKTKTGIPVYAFYKAEDSTASLWPVITNATNWNKGVLMAKHTIEFFSEHFGNYLYPQATVVSGPVEGMEYPMMIFAGTGDALSSSLEMVIAHELGHEWYPMMIGSNETRHPFMDEGFNTYITGLATNDYQNGKGLYNQDFYDKYKWMNLPLNNEHWFDREFYMQEARSGKGASLMSHPYDIPQQEYGVYAYMKPGSVLIMLGSVIGKETLHKVFREYHRRWQFKHPYPEDFFSIAEEVSGKNLRWFFHQWFEEKWKLDIALENVENINTGNSFSCSITLANYEQAKMPALLRLKLKDGSTKDVRFEYENWNGFNKATLTVDKLPAAVTNVVVDPNEELADVNRLNNSWNVPAPEFDYGFNLIGKLLYPSSRFRINFAPAFGFNLIDGLEFGTSVNSSFNSTDYNSTLQIRDGVRTNIPDVEFSYSTPLRSLSPSASLSFTAFRLDGRRGATLSFTGVYDKYTNLVNWLKHSFSFTGTLAYYSLSDSRYIGEFNPWTKGEQIFGKVSLGYRKSFNSGNIVVKATTENGLPGGDFVYSVYTAETKGMFTSGIADVRARLFYTTTSGNIPVQSMYSLGQGSGLEKFESWYFRTPVFGSNTTKHLYKAGGGNMLLGRDSAVSSFISGNISLHKGNFVIFGDYASVIDTASGVFSQPFFDAGAGLEFRSGNMSIGGLNIEATCLSFMFPLYVSNPLYPGEKKFAYRWQMVYGVRF